MIFLLDTDTLIFIIRGHKASTRAVARRRKAESIVKQCQQAQQAGDRVGVSAITVSELEFGARKSGQYNAEIGAVRKVMAPFALFDYDAVDCPAHYGEVRHALSKSGRPIGSLDLFIATHALALSATLVTNNQSHFSRVPGLRIENWS